jgi:exosortase A
VQTTETAAMSTQLAPAPSDEPRAERFIAYERSDNALLAIVAIVATTVMLFHQTIWTMVSLWMRSQTFAHGFLIVPISAWLVWRQRDRLACLPLNPCYGAFWLLMVLGAAWLLAAAGNVQIVMQYAVTAMIPTAVLAICGWRVVHVIAFPLAYLLLAVPFGEIFIPPLIDFTANFTVRALQLTGIPVYQESSQISIPSGNWSVVEACSGLRYIIASFALGTLYAYLNYQSLIRRLIFITASMIVPILANGVRAYLIVMLGHWSGMQLAIGFDHLIYGWVFFGLVCLILFGIGSFWQESLEPVLTLAVAPTCLRQRSRLYTAAIGCIVISACWPVLATVLLPTIAQVDGRENDQENAQEDRRADATITIIPTQPWIETERPFTYWRRAHAGRPATLEKNYIDHTQPDRAVGLQLAWYKRQQKDAELLTQVNSSSDAQAFHEIDSRIKNVQLGALSLSVQQSILRSNKTHLLVWRWYRQSGIDTSRPFFVKYLLAQNKLLHSRQDGAEIIVSIAFDGKPAQAELLLQRFLASMLPAIHQSLNHVASH